MITTGREKVINNHNVLTGLNSPDLHLEYILQGKKPPVRNQPGDSKQSEHQDSCWKPGPPSLSRKEEKESHLSVFLVVFRKVAFPWQLSFLPSGDKSCLQLGCDDGAEQETSGFQRDDYVYFSTVKVRYRVRGQTMFQVCDQDLESDWIPENREDVQKADALHTSSSLSFRPILGRINDRENLLGEILVKRQKSLEVFGVGHCG